MKKYKKLEFMKKEEGRKDFEIFIRKIKFNSLKNKW